MRLLLARFAFFIIVALIVITTTFSPFGREKTISVQGILVCKGKPAVGIKVKLYEQDTIWDDQLDVNYTDENGQFELRGTAREMSNIDPAIIAIHRCNHGGSCSHIWSYVLTNDTRQQERSNETEEIHLLDPQELNSCVGDRCRIECYD